MKPVLIFFFLISISIKVLAQETSVAGIIFDADSKDRLSRVNVLNLNTGASTYNNINGVFTIDAKPGDKIVFSQVEHFADTVIVKDYIPQAIYLRRIAIQLKQVDIHDSLPNPQARMALRRRDNSKIYGGSLGSKDMFSLTPGIGVGLSIDAIYNAFSKSGRNAAHLRETIEADYRDDVVDYRFNKGLVSRITGLKGLELTDFMSKYRPGYYFLANASEYEFINTIKNNLKRYRRNPAAHRVMPLAETKKEE
jgi:co-chaperonin GroES (HSP10)